jgi:hypothetical protein
MKTQKQAVIDSVVAVTNGRFKVFSDNAATFLSTDELEKIKQDICDGILTSTIQYSKDIANTTEVKAYARSMVMNHIKKAKELNSGNVYAPNKSTTTSPVSTVVTNKPKQVKQPKIKVPKGVKFDILPDYMKEVAINLAQKT